MNSFPLISHRMFLAAMGQKYPLPHPLRPGQNRRAAQQSQIRWDALSHLSPRQEQRALVAALVASHS